MPRAIEDPILAYTAEGEINNVQWASTQPDWIAICYNNCLEILRVVSVAVPTRQGLVCLPPLPHPQSKKTRVRGQYVCHRFVPAVSRTAPKSPASRPPPPAGLSVRGAPQPRLSVSISLFPHLPWFCY